MSTPETLFWVSAVLLVYTYAGYPALVFAWATLRPRPSCGQQVEPTVSIVLIAYNEAERIDARLRNLLDLRYSAGRVEITLASDGSTDDTVDRARAYEEAGVKVVAFERRRGKAAVLNDVVPSVTGEIVVLADARQRFETGALCALMAPFADPRVGAVSGELVLTADPDATTVGEGVGFYWRYEKFIRLSESRADSTVGATGAIYAIRRELFEPIPDDTILDDVAIPLHVVRLGYRTVFEPGARAFDRPVRTAHEEFVRKVRTIAGNFQILSREPWLFNPSRNRLWFQTVSHKALRLTIPLLHAAMLGTNLLLTGILAYQIALVAQVLFYTCAVIGCLRRHDARKLMCLTLPYTLCLLLAATVIAFVRFVRGQHQVMWERISPTGIPS
jgi:cellulose synthase/poly-beta-1,6-N-acetylglucosamine synthase-like glycosyltransferase